MKFVLNTFKYGLPRDANGICNSLTRIHPTSFDELLSRVNEFTRVEDDEIAVSGSADHRKGNGGGNGNGKFDRSKRKRNEDFSIVT